MEKREFRSKESYESERITRDLLPPFLESRGFTNVRDERIDTGMSVSQRIHATSPEGAPLTIRVKLCWYREDGIKRYATQLLAKIKNGDWEGSLQHFVDRALQDGVTHFLFAQREGENITSAALVPASEIVAVWCAQRDISNALIKAGRLGRRRKNHAMNGSSPTLWLEDEMAPEVTAALWKHAGVVNLLSIPFRSEIPESIDDTFADIPGLDYSLIGSDGGPRSVVMRSHVRRDHRVRTAVLERANGQCERCGAARKFKGFLDVHHVLGVETSDRVWNCVAICPNCHREAHFSADREQINAELLALAERSVSTATNAKKASMSH